MKAAIWALVGVISFFCILILAMQVLVAKAGGVQDLQAYDQALYAITQTAIGSIQALAHGAYLIAKAAFDAIIRLFQVAIG